MRKVDYETVNKVKSALLSFQRFQWEQGCTAQALLEFDGFPTRLFSFVRCAGQKEQGRTCRSHGENEVGGRPAAIGEALIVSAEKPVMKVLKKLQTNCTII